LQIVIAGASQTALSCLEQLLLQRHISFNSLTLLAPGGVPVGGVACTYTAGLVARMGVQAAVTIVDGQMASLDTAQKLVGLDDGSQLSYDLLVVATGLQVRHTSCARDFTPKHDVCCGPALVWDASMHCDNQISVPSCCCELGAAKTKC
jgi:hypothetical protein